MSGCVRVLSVLALLIAAADASAADRRFGPWRGVCDGSCRLVTPVEFGARLHVAPAADGGLGVAVTPLAPAPGTPVRFDFGDDAPTLTVPAGRWRLETETRLSLIDPHDRAAVLEWLFAAKTTTVRWRGADGAPRAAEIPTAEGLAALEWLVEATGHRVRVVDPETPRASWAADPDAFAAALDACRRHADHALVRVLNARRWTESEDALLVVAADGRRFHCVAPRDGSAVTAWEVVADEGTEGGPVLTLPPAGDCWTHEVLRDGAGALLGILSSRTC